MKNTGGEPHHTNLTRHSYNKFSLNLLFKIDLKEFDQYTFPLNKGLL